MSAIHRRGFLGRAGLAAGAIGLAGPAASIGASPTSPTPAPRAKASRPNPIGVSTYSFWQFRGERLGIPECIDRAAAMGFDGVELLLVQMRDTSNTALQEIKRRAHSQGLALMGFSTHQGFVHPDADRRKSEVEKTIGQIELAYALGIPTMRINTGRWGTSGSFDQLMANKGIEPPLEGHTEDEAFGWVIEAIEALLPKAAECGVVLGLENHWGLGRTAEGVLRIVETINDPWLQMTLDTGNFLENGYEQMEAMASSEVPLCLVQAKTYYGGGRWYALDLDYARIASILRGAGYSGWISLEFEGNDDAEEAVPRSLEMLRSHFS
ncbi:sugar phosphate isomerase/epimerase family protein [Tautonia sociabilis]|uniref:Sugar phosphate isomerase/epimerase n=1 Tax=Tautonia sociabilis TaxID=2080755 RepID=A0A432MK94_9BACT|nr:sugar phosphate isomerase/epimerase family protein [Tautonia sociabilis]RUL87821.1 sugar phosphate isomerase/epimerase [Tautonia sociabilis]